VEGHGLIRAASPQGFVEGQGFTRATSPQAFVEGQGFIRATSQQGFVAEHGFSHAVSQQGFCGMARLHPCRKPTRILWKGAALAVPQKPDKFRALAPEVNLAC
jgi:hypothetical protein